MPDQRPRPRRAQLQHHDSIRSTAPRPSLSAVATGLPPAPRPGTPGAATPAVIAPPAAAAPPLLAREPHVRRRHRHRGVPLHQDLDHAGAAALPEDVVVAGDVGGDVGGDALRGEDGAKARGLGEALGLRSTRRMSLSSWGAGAGAARPPAARRGVRTVASRGRRWNMLAVF